MLIDTSVEALVLLTLGHLIAMAMSSVAAFKEHREQRRSTLIGAYLFVAFISVLSIITYAPALVAWGVPSGFISTAETVRNMAILFFVIGLGDLLRKKSVTPTP